MDFNKRHKSAEERLLEHAIEGDRLDAYLKLKSGMVDMKLDNSNDLERRVTSLEIENKNLRKDNERLSLYLFYGEGDRPNDLFKLKKELDDERQERTDRSGGEDEGEPEEKGGS